MGITTKLAGILLYRPFFMSFVYKNLNNTIKNLENINLESLYTLFLLRLQKFPYYSLQMQDHKRSILN